MILVYSVWPLLGPIKDYALPCPQAAFNLIFLIKKDNMHIIVEEYICLMCCFIFTLSSSKYRARHQCFIPKNLCVPFKNGIIMSNNILLHEIQYILEVIYNLWPFIYMLWSVQAECNLICSGYRSMARLAPYSNIMCVESLISISRVELLLMTQYTRGFENQLPLNAHWIEKLNDRRGFTSKTNNLNKNWEQPQ